MSGRTIPFYQAAQLRALPGELRQQATAKGLEHAFAMDLFSLELNVKDAVEAMDAELAGRAQQQARELQAAIRAAPDKSDDLLLR